MSNMKNEINGTAQEIDRSPSTKEEIEAAVNACYGNPKNKITMPNIPGIPTESHQGIMPMDLAKDTKKDNKKETKNGKVKEIGELTITASACKKKSDKSFDSTIVEYIKGINRKIEKETQVGGYSTNVTIRVVQKDWVNVSHIMDWYRSKGFEVLNYRINNSPINMDTGVIEHNFTISWVN